MKKSDYIYIISVIVLIVLLIFIVFKKNVYQVVFAIDGEEFKTVEVRKDSSLKEKPIPEKEGKIFIGWYDEEGNVLESSTIISKDTVYYARWGEIVDN